MLFTESCIKQLKHIFAAMNLLYIISHWQLLVFYIFCGIAFIQLFYYLFFFSRLAFYKKKTKETSRTNAVSVVVCARDEAANLAKNIPGLLIQEYRTSHEVIVVNDNSFDDSKYVLEEFQKTYKQLKPIELIQEAKLIPGKKFPLSIGIKSAKHEIVLLTDADCVPATEHWIESMQDCYDENTEIVLGYGAFHKKKGLLNKLIRWEAFHTVLQYFSYALAGIPYMGVGRNLSYKKSVFYRHKGFSSHNNIPGGDDDLFINMAANGKNTKINIDPKSFTLSKSAASWNQWLKQKKRHYTTGKYYKASHKFLLGLYSFSHFLFFPLFVTVCIVYNWQYGLIIFAVRLAIQLLIYIRVLNKLMEKDLIPFILFFDIWMFFYYIIFFPALFKKPKTSWN